jgi:hypothetical protein
MKMILLRWADWISRTQVSQTLSNHQWIVPTSQSIHILAVSVVFSCAVMISLRLLGVGQRGRSLSQLTQTLVPWMYRGLAVLLLTGVVQTIAEPVRQFVTPAFWSKMFMIVCALTLTIWLARTVASGAQMWDSPSERPAYAKLWGLVSLGLWIAIIFCGRFIGYTWESHL